MALIDMNVGVAEAEMAVGGTGVEVGDTEATGGGEEVGVDKTSTEKVQASSSSVINIKLIIMGNHLRCFIAFSLFTLVDRMVSDEAYFPRKEAVAGTSYRL